SWLDRSATGRYPTYHPARRSAMYCVGGGLPHLSRLGGANAIWPSFWLQSSTDTGTRNTIQWIISSLQLWQSSRSSRQPLAWSSISADGPPRRTRNCTSTAQVAAADCAIELSKRAIKARVRAAAKPSFSRVPLSHPSRAKCFPSQIATFGRIDSTRSPCPADLKGVGVSRHADRVRATCLTPRVCLWYLTVREQGSGPVRRVPNGPK